MSLELNKWAAFAERQTEERMERIRAFNATYRPIAEMEDPEMGLTLGVFKFDDGWFYADKYAVGYNPDRLVNVPDFVVQAILKAS